jgi:hypothetical protein
MEYNELSSSANATSSQKPNQQASKSVFESDSLSAFDNLWKGLSVTDSDVANQEIIHFDTHPLHLDQERNSDDAGAELNMLRKFRTTNWACL